MHNLEKEVHGLEEEVQVLEGEVHEKELLVYKAEPEKRRRSDFVGNKIIFAIVFILLAGLFVMALDKKGDTINNVASDAQSKELKKMLDEVERTKQELERMKSKEAERLIEMAKIKSDEIKRESALMLEKAKKEELRISKEKTQAMIELKIAREKAIRAEKRIDDMFKQRKIEEQKRHNELLAREKAIEQERAELNKKQTNATNKREAIQATFDEIDSSLKESKAAVEEKTKAVVVEKNTKKSKSFVTDPCSSSSARFLSTCR